MEPTWHTCCSALTVRSAVVKLIKNTISPALSFSYQLVHVLVEVEVVGQMNGIQIPFLNKDRHNCLSLNKEVSSEMSSMICMERAHELTGGRDAEGVCPVGKGNSAAEVVVPRLLRRRRDGEE